MTAITDHTLDVPRFEGNIEDRQSVVVEGDRITIAYLSSVMSREEALIHAAWIVARLDQSENFNDFRSVLKAVLSLR